MESPHCCSDGCCPVAFPVCCATHCCPSGSYCCSQWQCCSRRLIRAIPPFIPAKRDYSMSHFAELINVAHTEVESKTFDAGQITWNLISKRQVTLFSGPCNSYEREKLNEGFRPHVYHDSRGIPTVGVGFNLRKAGARQWIESVGANYNEVLNGYQTLTDDQIKALFDRDMRTAVTCTMNWLPTWSSLGHGPQSAMADMAFNLGCTRLRGFKCLKKALSKSPPDLQQAIVEMRHSRWCRQVGRRCDRDIRCMK